MHILLIDDDPIGIYLSERLLKHEGFFDMFTTFRSPVEGLAFLQRQIPAGLLPQVILLDLNMPLIAGWGLLDKLKPHQAQLQGQCVIYLLSSSLDPSDIARAKEHPLVTQLIHKPLNGSKIHEIHEQVQTMTSSQKSGPL